MAVLLTLTACNAGPEARGDSGQAPVQPSADYLAPPQPRAVEVTGGRTVLIGAARPGARVTVRAPGAPSVAGATADSSGAFRVDLPAGGARLFAMAMQVAGQAGEPRSVEAEGYLFVAPGRAALLRAGAGSVVLSPPGPRMRITALDHDGAGGAVIAGFAPPGARLNAQVDGVSRAQSVTNREGRFNIALAPLAAGQHQLAVAGAGQSASVSVLISPAAPLTQPPFRAERGSGGWRVDWMTPAGGLQTSLLLD